MMWEVRFEGLPDDARAKPLLAWGIFLACLPLRLIYAALSSDNCCDCIPSNTSILGIRYTIGYIQVYLYLLHLSRYTALPPPAFSLVIIVPS